ncbi:MAG: 30S ribosomal protein S4e [Sulfolobaceae archaeon]
MAHITRFEAPFFLAISKKEYKWTVRASPGPYKLSESIPLAIFLRDYLKIATTLREARRIIAERKVLVDGKIRTDYKFPVGRMAVVSIPAVHEYYRVIPHPVKFLWPIKITSEEAKYKYVRIMNKTIVKGGLLQLNLEDGRNILVPKEKFSEYNLPTLTTLKIELLSQNIIDVFPLKEGSYAIIIGGKNVGIHGIIKSIQYAKYKRKKYSIVTLETKDNKIYQTNLINVMSIGKEKSDMRLESI